MGFGQRPPSPSTTWEGIPGVPDCSAPRKQLQRCREGVARTGKGHCMVAVNAYLGCERDRSTAKSLVMGKCAALHAALAECSGAGDGGASCAAKGAEFANCASAAVAGREALRRKR